MSRLFIIMAMENWIDERDITVRLESDNPTIFQEAYEELLRSAEYARQRFQDTAIYSCFRRTLEKYNLRYEETNPILRLL